MNFSVDCWSLDWFLADNLSLHFDFVAYKLHTCGTCAVTSRHGTPRLMPLYEGRRVSCFGRLPEKPPILLPVSFSHAKRSWLSRIVTHSTRVIDRAALQFIVLHY